jgi:hypothetical protein
MDFVVKYMDNVLFADIVPERRPIEFNGNIHTGKYSMTNEK